MLMINVSRCVKKVHSCLMLTLSIERGKTTQTLAKLKKVAKELQKSEVRTSILIVPSDHHNNIILHHRMCCFFLSHNGAR